MPAKILIVDDEPRIADSVREIVAGAGYEAVCAYNPVDAMYNAVTLRPDVLLSDVLMQGMNGFELALQIKRRVPSCRPILFSGQAATVQLAHDFGEIFASKGIRFELLPKPVRPEILLEKIQQSLMQPT
ncbi:MAG TPA: response regulator [Terriglobales bacterium]|nr:response regulator [Terriglobales bacterium]